MGKTILKIFHIAANAIELTSSRRNTLMARWRRLTHWKPMWYRWPTKSGISSSSRIVKVTVSLTSYPARIGTIHHTIASLLTQTMMPDRVTLWLGEEKFPLKEADLPKKLLALRQYGLTICWTRDKRSYTKLLPALKAYPDDIIITCDDDILYNPDMVESLYNSYQQDQSCIHTQAAMRMESNGAGGLSSYNDWWYCKTSGEKSYANLLMGVNGVLYPPHSMPDEVFNEDVFTSIAPTTDDLWFWAMAVLNGRRICNLDANGIAKTSPNFDIVGPSLWSINENRENGNDKQLRAILDKYPTVKANLQRDLK